MRYRTRPCTERSMQRSALMLQVKTPRRRWVLPQVRFRFVSIVRDGDDLLVSCEQDGSHVRTEQDVSLVSTGLTHEQIIAQCVHTLHLTMRWCYPADHSSAAMITALVTRRNDLQRCDCVISRWIGSFQGRCLFDGCRHQQLGVHAGAQTSRQIPYQTCTSDPGVSATYRGTVSCCGVH